MAYSLIQFIWKFKKFFHFTSRETVRTWAAFSNTGLQVVVILRLFELI